MAKKQPINNSYPSINFKLSQELKHIIEEKAVEKNVTISSYVRDLLESVHSGEYCQKEDIKSEINSFLFSKEFLQLMIWIYSKKQNNALIETPNQMEGYLKTLKRLDGFLPNELVMEFDKVMTNIIKKRTEGYSNYTTFEFHRYSIENINTFNLKAVESFLLHDNNLNTFIEEKVTNGRNKDENLGICM